MHKVTPVQAPPNPPAIPLMLFLGALSAFGPMSVDMYLPAFPLLETELQAAGGQVQLTLGGFLLGFGVGQLFYGPLSDRFGRLRPLLAALVVYALASAGCALTGNIETLIALRFLQGISACAGPVLARAMVADLYARERAAGVLSLVTLVMGIAPIVAPLVGGYTMLLFGWRAIFWVLVGFGGFCILAAGFGIGETLGRPYRARMSGYQMARRYADLLANRSYLGFVLTFGFAYAGLFAYIAESPFVFITVFGVPAQYYGLLFGLNAVAMVVSAYANSRLLARYDTQTLLRFGAASAAVSGVALAIVVQAGAGLALLQVPLFCFMASLSFVGPNAMASALATFRHMAGSASAFAGFFQFSAGAVFAAAASVLHDGTARPMAWMIAAAGCVAFGAYCLLVRPQGKRRNGSAS